MNLYQEDGGSDYESECSGEFNNASHTMNQWPPQNSMEHSDRTCIILHRSIISTCVLAVLLHYPNRAYLATAELPVQTGGGHSA